MNTSSLEGGIEGRGHSDMTTDSSPGAAGEAECEFDAGNATRLTWRSGRGRGGAIKVHTFGAQKLSRWRCCNGGKGQATKMHLQLIDTMAGIGVYDSAF